MLKVLLIDDEERATDALRLMITKFIPEISQVMVCNDARHAAETIHSYQPSLVFLDIRMPYLTGFDLLNNIPGKKFKVIFTTAYNEYAIKAIRFSAFDYLLKPVDVEELIDAVKRFIQVNADYSQQQALLQNIMHNMQTPEQGELRLALPTKEGVHYVLPHEIIRCEALGNYHFIRTHKSKLVNKQFISFIDHDGFVILKDATKIEVSRRRKEEVMNTLRGA